MNTELNIRHFRGIRASSFNKEFCIFIIWGSICFLFFLQFVHILFKRMLHNKIGWIESMFSYTSINRHDNFVTDRRNIMIEIQNLTKHYGEIKAVEDVNFTVEKGEILGFLG